MTNRHFIRAADVPNYHPANHSGTFNTRLIDPKRIGAGNVEIVHGTLQQARSA